MTTSGARRFATARLLAIPALATPLTPRQPKQIAPVCYRSNTMVAYLKPEPQGSSLDGAFKVLHQACLTEAQHNDVTLAMHQKQTQRGSLQKGWQLHWSDASIACLQ